MWPFRKKVDVWRNCPLCEGKGDLCISNVDGNRPIYKTCSVCNGLGGRYYRALVPEPEPWVVCPACDGGGLRCKKLVVCDRTSGVDFEKVFESDGPSVLSADGSVSIHNVLCVVKVPVEPKMPCPICKGKGGWPKGGPLEEPKE